MKQLIFSLVMLCSCVLQTFSQDISTAEYFWDTDPGVGNGITIPITPGQILSETATISADGLTEGLHTVYIRTMDESGAWSHYKSVLVFVSNNELFEIVAAEYFWDTDPGVGNGIPININPDFSITSQLSLTADIAPGIHYLHIRVLDESHAWSHYQRIMVIVEENLIREIVSMEYFWDTDPGVGNASAVDIDDVFTFDGEVPVSTDGLSLGTHTLYIRVQDESHTWSHYKAVVFTLCETFGAVSDFESVVDGANVVATYTGSFATSYQWLLDDVEIGNSEEVVTTPVIEQELCLIASNSCAVDTTCTIISSAQLISVDPNSVPNNLTQTIDLTGFGFTEDAAVRIEKGVELIDATTVTYNSSTSLTAGFDFDMETIGLWDVIVTQGEATELVLAQGLELTTWIGVEEFGAGNYVGEPYPNPAGDLVYIPYKFEGMQLLAVRIYDVSGKLLNHQIWQPQGSGNFKIGLEDFATGSYLLEISGSTGKRTHLIMKD